MRIVPLTPMYDGYISVCCCFGTAKQPFPVCFCFLYNFRVGCSFFVHTSHWHGPNQAPAHHQHFRALGRHQGTHLNHTHGGIQNPLKIWASATCYKHTQNGLSSLEAASVTNLPACFNKQSRHSCSRGWQPQLFVPSNCTLTAGPMYGIFVTLAFHQIIK